MMKMVLTALLASVAAASPAIAQDVSVPPITINAGELSRALSNESVSTPVEIPSAPVMNIDVQSSRSENTPIVLASRGDGGGHRGGGSHGGGRRGGGSWGGSSTPSATPAPAPTPRGNWGGGGRQREDFANRGESWRRSDNVRSEPREVERNWQRPAPVVVQSPAPVVVQSPAPRGGEGRGWDGGRRGGDRGNGRGWNGGSGGSVVHVAPQPRHGGDRRHDNDGRWGNDRRHDNDRRWDNDRRENRRHDGGWRGSRHGNYGYNNNYGYTYGHNSWSGNRWNNSWRRDTRYNWEYHRNSYRHLYRAPSYYHPYGNGYGYRRFSVGFFLDSLFFSQRYWISDPYEYRLPPVYGPYRWVRYYNDVLLIDVRSGEVVDMISNFFW